MSDEHIDPTLRLCVDCKNAMVPQDCDPCRECLYADGKPNWVARQRRSLDDATPAEWNQAARQTVPKEPKITLPGPIATEGLRRVPKAADPRKAAEHPLYEVFMAAIEQAMFGKGERHGGAQTEFTDQPWVHYGKMHGRGFLTGQAAKKLEEAASTRNGAAFETEVFGAMVYMGMAILHERKTLQTEASHG
jgi:hypothetical protein